jgi:hypothetical protein
MEHSRHNHHPVHHQPEEEKKENFYALAFSATLHCLLGCGIGEVMGMIFSVWLALSMLASMVISIVFGFIMGLALGVLPLLRRKFTFKNALKIVLVGEGLSIAVMEAFEVGTQFAIPGVMTAGLSDAIFWIGMFVSLVVGFAAAFPVNLIMIRRGVRHVH